MTESWITRSLPHSVFWGDGAHTIEAKSSGQLLMIDMYESNTSQANRICLTLKFHFEHIELVDLTGNASGQSTNNVGIGTLLVNLAIQILRALYQDRLHEMKISGTTCPQPGLEPAEQAVDVANRVRFWSSFNLTIDEPELPRASIKGVLSELRLKDRGKCMGKINTLLSINDFWRGYHRPNLFPHEIEALRRLEINKASLTALPTDEEIGRKEETAQNLYFYVRMALTIIIAIFILQFMQNHNLWSTRWLAAAGTIMFALHWTFHRITFPYIAKHFYQNKTRKEKELVVKREQQKLIDVTKDHPLILKRLYRSVIEKWPDQISNVLASSCEDSEFVYYRHDQKTILEWAEFLKSFNDEFARYINKNHYAARIEVKDHLFETNSNSVSVSDLTRYAEILDTEFEFHLNRLLRSIGSRELCVSGSSNACPKAILKKLNSIAMIELFPSAPYMSDTIRVQMKIILREGTLYFEPQWGIYNDIRRNDTLSVLSILREEELRKKTFIRDGNQLIPLSPEPEDFILQILDLGNCRQIDEGELDKYSKRLESTGSNSYCY